MHPMALILEILVRIFPYILFGTKICELIFKTEIIPTAYFAAMLCFMFETSICHHPFGYWSKIEKILIIASAICLLIWALFENIIFVILLLVTFRTCWTFRAK